MSKKHSSVTFLEEDRVLSNTEAIARALSKQFKVVKVKSNAEKIGRSEEPTVELRLEKPTKTLKKATAKVLAAAESVYFRAICSFYGDADHRFLLEALGIDRYIRVTVSLAGTTKKPSVIVAPMP